ncbi:hypothetical protein [Alcanivorax sp.]|uniref:hypothetical protein n=1 Tax=Alcanivorax sp. TaxID=1872427 RepID=UPI000C0F8366|nr:hypothetical protein [Alcanivorax sp.]PHR68561.1 MAG: hypothetical protein COA55_00670 [Alcanivorax sp.]
MRFIGLVMLLAGLWVTPAMAAEQASDTKTAQTKSADEAEKSPEQQAMDKLAAAGIGEAIKAIKKFGSFYPFGLVQKGDSAQAMTYTGEKEDAPAPEQWVEVLYRKLQEEGKKKPDVDMLALFRLHEISDDEGNQVIGVWALVDHRDVRPWVIFLPFLEKDNGKYEPGEPVYYPTDQSLFDHSE